MKSTHVACTCQALVLAMAASTCQAMLVKTYGRGDTTAAAVSDGKRQAMKDAADAVVAGKGMASVELAPQIGPVHVIRTTKLAPGWYEAELEANVRMIPAPASSRMRVAILANPYATDDGTASSVMDDAVARLSAAPALAIVGSAAGPAGRLYDRVRDGAGSVRIEQRKKEATEAFDVLFVLSADEAGIGGAMHGRDSQEMRIRVSIIDARTETLLVVATVRASLMHLPTDMRAALVRDAGRQTANLVKTQAEQMSHRKRRDIDKRIGAEERNGMRRRLRNGIPEVISDGDW